MVIPQRSAYNPGLDLYILYSFCSFQSIPDHLGSPIGPWVPPAERRRAAGVRSGAAASQATPSSFRSSWSTPGGMAKCLYILLFYVFFVFIIPKKIVSKFQIIQLQNFEYVFLTPLRFVLKIMVEFQVVLVVGVVCAHLLQVQDHEPGSDAVGVPEVRVHAAGHHAGPGPVGHAEPRTPLHPFPPVCE